MEFIDLNKSTKDIYFIYIKYQYQVDEKTHIFDYAPAEYLILEFKDRLLIVDEDAIKYWLLDKTFEDIIEFVKNRKMEINSFYDNRKIEIAEFWLTTSKIQSKVMNPRKILKGNIPKKNWEIQSLPDIDSFKLKPIN